MTTKIAVLLTCHNRKDKTISCLNHLFEAYKAVQDNLKIKVYLTDDGSSDGTSETVKEIYPEVIILRGDGNLFWAGGMRNSWKEALKSEYDAYLLLNDDTNVYPVVFNEMLETHKFSVSNYGRGGIYICSTKDSTTNKLSYGGAVITNKFLLKYKKLEPNKSIQDCDLGNCNIAFISRDAFKQIGIISTKYIHGVADYAYTLTAKKNKVPVLLTANYCGICDENNENKYEIFSKMNFLERVRFLYNPLGLAFNDNLNLMKSFFPSRLPFVFIAGWFKILFPKIYIAIKNLR